MNRGKRFQQTARFHKYSGRSNRKDCSTEDCKPGTYASQLSLIKKRERDDAIRRNPELSKILLYR